MFKTPQDLMLFLMALSLLFLIVIIGIAVMQARIVRTMEEPITKMETGNFQADDLKKYENHPNPEIREFARQTQLFMSEMERTQRMLNEQSLKNKNNKGDA